MAEGNPQSNRHLKPMAAGQRGIDPVGRALIRKGLLSSRSLFEMEARVQRSDVRLADALRLSLDVPAADIAEAEAEAAGAICIDPIKHPPDPALITQLGATTCARMGVLPWRRSGGNVVILTSRPDQISRYKDAIIAVLGPISIAISTDDKIRSGLEHCAAASLAASAETRVPDEVSCRNWHAGLALRLTLAVLAGLLTAFLLAPTATYAALTIWAVTTLALSTTLKGAAFAFFLRRRPAPPRARARALPLRLPTVSILVPLFKERAIASHLLTRLQALDYPHELLDICLVMEQEDVVTRTTIAATTLPPWIRTITVPDGTLKTKPRALNYALDFARGSIIGVYDAEDAPAPDQINRVVARFATAPPQVACLQGILDFYNARTNWLSRCFTLEYATWFRVMLPGLERLGLVIPLGGTTLFFRRSVLEELGGWDAHNVTEDADLGIRLARAGYRTELIETVTEEEANCRVWPWIKQRSRWLKGYAITYGVHMRNPAKLWREVGAWRFFGIQVLFAGTLSQFVLAPVLWSFWAYPLGLPHPLAGAISTPLLWGLGALFLASEVLNIAVAATAVERAGRPRIMWWAPTLHFYFPLAAMGCYKGLVELMFRPFYWDKTQHGIYLPKAVVRAGKRAAKEATPRPPRPRRQVAAE